MPVCSSCGPPKTLVFFAPARFALLRCKTPKTVAAPFAIKLRSDVAASVRRFSRPHRFRVLQFDEAFAHDLIQGARIAFRLRSGAGLNASRTRWLAGTVHNAGARSAHTRAAVDSA
jgi:hypothetical protein